MINRYLPTRTCQQPPAYDHFPAHSGLISAMGDLLVGQHFFSWGTPMAQGATQAAQVREPLRTTTDPWLPSNDQRVIEA